MSSALFSLVVCGPSGSGKSTLLKRLLNEFNDCFKFSVSHTTRKRRKDEEMDREYHFVSKELFRQMIERKEFLEWTQFSGHFYGTSWAALQDVQRSGRIAVLDLEIKGVAKVKEAGLLTKCVLIRTRELEQLEKNLRARGTESQESLDRRLARAKEDLEEVDRLAKSGNQIFDKTIINEDVEKAFAELKDFVKDDIAALRTKICLLGDSGVGKSSLVTRFVHNTFNPQNESTIGASFMSKTFSQNAIQYKFNIWDTAGQERYRALAPMYYRQAAVCIVVYDVTQQETFRAVHSWVRELRAHLKSEKCLIVICGNKCDLSDRQVAPQEGRDFAESVSGLFFETSAKSSENVWKMFLKIASRLPREQVAPSVAERGRLLSNEGVIKEKTKCC